MCPQTHVAPHDGVIHPRCGMRMLARPELLLAHLLPHAASTHHHVHLQRLAQPFAAVAPPNSPAHAPERKNSVPNRAARCSAAREVTCAPTCMQGCRAPAPGERATIRPRNEPHSCAWGDSVPASHERWHVSIQRGGEQPDEQMETSLRAPLADHPRPWDARGAAGIAPCTRSPRPPPSPIPLESRRTGDGAQAGDVQWMEQLRLRMALP